jgi:hypothetical protein
VKRSRGRGRRPQGGGGGGGHHHNHNRSFDSTGPDVKIRGTAANVYEKYLQLARDAGSAGDRVMAENYLQHAEHYYRILMAQGGQLNQQQGGQMNQGQGDQPHYPGAGPQPQPNGGGEGMPPQVAQPFQQAPGSAPSFSLAEAEGVEEGDEVA